MSLSSSFDYLVFQRKVQGALRVVERTLELERHPRLAADVEHSYGAKYALVDATSNAAVIAYLHCLHTLGLDAAALRSIDTTKPATLRFESSISCAFSREVEVAVPVGRSYEEREETVGCGDQSQTTSKTKVMKAVNRVTEFHWDVGVEWSISVYAGTSVGDKKVLKSRSSRFALITQSKHGVGPATLPPIELSLTWLLHQVDTANLSSRFKVDTNDDETRTPRRNAAVRGALDFAARLAQWCASIARSFAEEHLGNIVRRHDPARPQPAACALGRLAEVGRERAPFNPILPLMEEGRPSEAGGGGGRAASSSSVGLPRPKADSDEQSTLLSSDDMTRLLNEHARTLAEGIGEIEKSWPPDSGQGILSSAEASLSLVCHHLGELSARYIDAMSYVESMLEHQLVAAIGKRLTPHDLDTFVKFHNARLLRPMPQPFSHAICRPEHYPVGLLSIETQDDEHECIHTHSRGVKGDASLKIPLTAATVLELTGQQHLHGYTNHRFGSSRKPLQLVARARQFSAFVLVIGTMTDGSTLDPKDAIIVQNKDELLIPLLLEELPTAKEFKDAVTSLSPEQQRFARAYRKMQLASSVFGACVVQIKPSLEALLGLPADALDKEMQLTQDLMELFIDYQVPSDLLSYASLSDTVATEEKISNVRTNVKGVMDVINEEKEKQLKTERAKAEMATKRAIQRAADSEQFLYTGGLSEGPLMSDCTLGPSKGTRGRSRASGDRSCAAPNARNTGSAPLISAYSYAGPPPPPHPTMEITASRSAVPSEERFEQNRNLTQQEKPKKEFSSEKQVQAKPLPGEGVDVTLVPQLLDAAIEKSGGGNALRSTTIKTGNGWVRNRQENLLTGLKRHCLNAEDIKQERNKAFDLLDALSRSGSLPIAYSDLHVVIAVTHCFDKDVTSTVVCDNVNPIEKLENSTLLLASAVHSVPVRELVSDAEEMQRLEGSLPLLFKPVHTIEAQRNENGTQG